MSSALVNLAALKIPAVAVTLIFINLVHTGPVPVNYSYPACPADNTKVAPSYLTH